MATLSQGVFRKLPPRASSGMKPIEWSAPSSRPQRFVTSAATAAICSSLLTSMSSTSGTGSSFFATRCVILTARPTLVSSTSAPASCATFATAKAMESSVRTPVISSFFPSSNKGGGSSADWTDAGPEL